MRVENTSSASTDTGTPLASRTLGKDFMHLLVTQLQNQDPMQPLQDRELISQLAQLSTLDSLQNIEQLTASQNMLSQLTQAAGLIGRSVTARSGESVVSGQVTAATVQADNQVMVTIGEHAVNLADILSVVSPS